MRTNAILVAGAIIVGAAVSMTAAEVRVQRVPENGLQPSAVTGGSGVTHLVYLVGDTKTSDIHYVRRGAGETNWSSPIRVNSQPGSAIAIGTIRGPQLALGRNGRVHVCWNGSRQSASADSAALWYTCSNDGGTAFEPERDLIGSTRHLDGGGSVAADTEGRVFVVWHANPKDGPDGELARAVFVAASSDDGKSFTEPKSMSPPGSGVCGCCGLQAFANPHGDVSIAFRSAGSATKRDMVLLQSRDHGRSFAPVLTHEWNIATCPMSSASLRNGLNQTWAAWETGGKVFAARLGSPGAAPFELSSSKGKHPRTATNARGETLAVWVEGTGWMKGGAVAWKVFDREGKPTETKGRQDGVPVWSFGDASTRNDSSFEVIY